MKEGYRDNAIDIIKAVCIVFMVVGHAGMGLPYLKFIYFFHMPVFFLVSGYVYNSKYSENFVLFVEFCKKKIKRLWFPWFIATSIFIVLNNFFIYINVYSINPLLLEMGTGELNYLTEYLSVGEVVVEVVRAITFNSKTQLGGALWFLKILFFLTILYAFIELIIKTILTKRKSRYFQEKTLLIQGIISILFCLIGYRFFWYVGVNNDTQLMVSSYYFLYYLGVLFKKYHERIDEIHGIIKFFVWLFSLAILVCFTVDNNILKFNLVGREYGNPLILLVASISGFLFLYYPSKLVSFFSNISKPIVYIGKNTMPILILHFFVLR